MSSKKPTTRSIDYLIRPSNQQITSAKLPTNYQVIARYLGIDKEVGQTRYSVASNVYDEVMAIWNAARIPTQNRQAVVSKILKLRDKLIKLRSNRHQKSSADDEQVKLK